MTKVLIGIAVGAVGLCALFLAILWTGAKRELRDLDEESRRRDRWPT